MGRVEAATEAAREEGRRQIELFGVLARGVRGLQPAPVAGEQSAEGQPQVLIIVEGSESWVGKGGNRHKVGGCASFVLRPDGSMVFVPGKLANASEGTIPLRELRGVDGDLAKLAQRAIIADKRERTKRWRGNPGPKIK